MALINIKVVCSMFRKINQNLIDWKNKKNHMPLVLFGARQVGKTYTLKEFASQNYANSVCVSLEADTYIVDEINKDIRPQTILKALSDYSGQVIIPGKTLIILDEVQSCERALTALKYFTEQQPGYDIIAAGSLLGVAVNRNQYSFPVGKVEVLRLYPMDFEEYLIALGKKDRSDRIRAAFLAQTEMPGFIHDELIKDYRDFLLCGGMPAVVQQYISDRDHQQASSVATNIITQYLADMTKYCGAAESVKIRMAYDSIPTQLAKENTKFQYAVAKKGASASYFGSSIDWLLASGTVLQCRKINQGYFPPASYLDIAAFKLYMSDTGLLSARVQATPAVVSGRTKAVAGFRGNLTENYVACALASNQHELFYWESDGKAEIDFVIAKDGATIPIEVKAADNTKSKSLQVFINRYEPPFAIRLSGRNFGFSGKIMSLPLYAAFLI
jgi:predicted AAA+ superfamily ATPase